MIGPPGCGRLITQGGVSVSNGQKIYVKRTDEKPQKGRTSVCLVIERREKRSEAPTDGIN